MGSPAPPMDTECTKENPSRTARYHPDAREVGEQEDGYPAGDIVTLDCPSCGVRWREELLQ